MWWIVGHGVYLYLFFNGGLGFKIGMVEGEMKFFSFNYENLEEI